MGNNAFVFPGQGSQYVGMLSDIAQSYPDVEAVYAEASQILGYDLWALVRQGPAEVLNQTAFTQPAILTGSYAIWRILQAKTTLRPVLLAGHSLGEYTALLCAGAISFRDAVRLVSARGHYMQEAVPAGQGALAAIIGLEDSVVSDLCQKAVLDHEVLAPANFNSPGQVVIAGDKSAVERACVLAKNAGARMTMLLPVSSPSHCDLMIPAAKRLEKLLSEVSLQLPSIPVLNNVDVEIYRDEEHIRSGLVRQLYQPVRWVEVIQNMVNRNITHIVECGPGKILSGLIKRINTNIILTQTHDIDSLSAIFESSLETKKG